MQAIEHGHVPTGMYIVTALLLGGAFFPPTPRVAAFASGIVTIVFLYGKEVRIQGLEGMRVLRHCDAS